MKTVLRIMLFEIFAFYTCTGATVINIPADYPTIQQGIDASIDGDTVLVQPGTYVENINFNGHNIVLGSLFLTTGDVSYITSTSTDGNANGTVITIIDQGNTSAMVSGFTVQNGHSDYGAGFEIFQSNPLITNNLIQNNIAEEAGGAIECYYADARIEKNIMRNNFGKWKGGGIYSILSEPIISNNLLINNSSDLWGAGITCYYSNAVIINNTLYRNTAPQGGGIACWLNSNPIIKNNIFWRNAPFQIYTYSNSTPEITYCDIDGGWPGIGNIDANPKFRNYANDFRLKSAECGNNQDSPCIDAGDPSIQDLILDCDWGLGSQLSDMGAYGGGDSLITAIDNCQTHSPVKFMFITNYPNPFNARTNIEFTLPEKSYISIAICNILGRELVILYEGMGQPGTHNVTWNAGAFPSGVYFAKIKTNNYSKTLKMLLLK